MKYKIPYLTCASVLGIVAQYVLSYFGFELSSPVLNAMITLVCGVLAVAGVVAPHGEAGQEEDENKDEEE